MVIYIATVWAKPGHEDHVTRYYRDLEPLMRAAKGYRGRRILRAQPGTVLAAVSRFVSKEDLARHAEHAGPDGVHFVILEEWDSIEERVAFSRTAVAGRGEGLFAHILPQHSHEFYEDVSPA